MGCVAKTYDSPLKMGGGGVNFDDVIISLPRKRNSMGPKFYGGYDIFKNIKPLLGCLILEDPPKKK